MSKIDGICKNEAIESEGLERTHAQERDAFIQLLAKTKMRLMQMNEEFDFLSAVSLALSSCRVEDTKAWNGFLKLSDSAATLKILVAKIGLAIGYMGIFAPLFSAKELQESNQKFKALEVPLDSIDSLLDQVAVGFNTLPASFRTDLQDRFAKNGLTLSPVFLARCEQVAKRAIAA